MVLQAQSLAQTALLLATCLQSTCLQSICFALGWLSDDLLEDVDADVDDLVGARPLDKEKDIGIVLSVFIEEQSVDVQFGLDEANECEWVQIDDLLCRVLSMIKDVVNNNLVL